MIQLVSLVPTAKSIGQFDKETWYDNYESNRKKIGQRMQTC